MIPIIDRALSGLNQLLRDGVISLAEWRNEVILPRKVPIS